MKEKEKILSNILKEYGRCIIAFSGGVDSTFLAHMAKKVLKDNVLLVTAHLKTFPERELEEAKKIAAQMKLQHRIVSCDIPDLLENRPDRCYYCKREIFRTIKNIALSEKIEAIFDGSNADDTFAYRPGRKALNELAIRSPLGEANLSKKEIRDLSKKAGLITFQKPSTPCLATRFFHGEKITELKLKRVEQAENSLHDLGFSQFRVRSHEDMARIEFVQDEMEIGWEKRELIKKICLEKGFSSVVIDLEGYRSGSMNKL